MPCRGLLDSQMRHLDILRLANMAAGCPYHARLPPFCASHLAGRCLALICRSHLTGQRLTPTPGMQLEIRDGLQAVADAAAGPADERLDLLVVDAGSSDASLPMSCPPPSFLEPQVC